MKESAFQSWIVEVAKLHGWSCWHVPTPMKPIGNNRFVPDARGRGLPDLILLREDPPQVIFAEIKNETGTVAPEQHEFLRLIRNVGEDVKRGMEFLEDTQAPWDGPPPVQAFLWRPAHRDLIEAVLSAR